MKKTVLFGGITALAFFGGVHYLLSVPVPARTPASIDPEIHVVQEMAKFVEKNPEFVKRIAEKEVPKTPDHDTKAPMVLGVYLDERSIQEFKETGTPGYFHQQFEGVSNFASAVQDVNQAWFHIEERDFTRREALLEVTGGLAKVSGEAELKERMLGEFDKYQAMNDLQGTDVDYAGKALQKFLDNEPDPAKRLEELKKRGIPVIEIPAKP